MDKQTNELSAKLILQKIVDCVANGGLLVFMVLLVIFFAILFQLQ